MVKTKTNILSPIMERGGGAETDNTSVSYIASEETTGETTTEKYLASTIRAKNNNNEIVTVQLIDSTAIHSHIGQIIFSSTLDTEEKVKAIYGGVTWNKIEGKFLLGASEEYEVNSTGGEKEHILNIAEMPSHSHDTAKSNMLVNGGVNFQQYSTYQHEDNITAGNYWCATTLPTGSSMPHNNMPPYKAVYIWERTA